MSAEHEAMTEAQRAYLATEPRSQVAALDAVDAQEAQARAAEALMPALPAEDLFGDPIDGLAAHEVRQTAKARRMVQTFRLRLFQAGIDPLDVMARCMMLAFEKGDYETAHKRASDLAPYMSPKLTAVAIAAPAGAGTNGGRLSFSWTPEADGEPGEVVE